MTEQLVIQNKDIVVPGDILATGLGFVQGPGTYRENDNVIAGMLGMANVDGKVIKITPLSGRYMPKVNDRVIGKIVDVLMTGWMTDINCPYTSVLSMKDATSDFIPRGADLTQFFTIGEYIFAQVCNVTSQNLTDISMKGPGLRKLEGGRVIQVNPQKVPRIIGKDGSMVTMIKDETGCYIYVGQNGRIWISGEPQKENMAVDVIRFIEANAHKQGLTDQVKELLSKK